MASRSRLSRPALQVRARRHSYLRRAVVIGLLALLVLPGSALALSRGDSGEAVLALNKRLAKLGYMPGERVGPRYSDATVHAVIAFEKKAGLARDGVADEQMMARLERASRPRAMFPRRGRHVEIRLGQQLLMFVRADGTVARTIAISSGGSGHSTPTGNYRVARKERMSWSVPYSSWMPWASYFSGGYAIHEYPEVPVYPASHGCVRVPAVFSREVYAFAGVGTPVVIRY